MSIKTQRIGHVTLIGSNEADTVAFYQGVLGMPLVLRQPNLDEPATLHLFFDAGNGSYLTFFVQAERASDSTPVPWAVGSVHHVAFDVVPEVFERAIVGLRAHGVAHSGRVDRGAFWSLYFRDPNGMLLELSNWKIAIPPGVEKGAVLKRAQVLREEDGAYHVTERHLEQALQDVQRDLTAGPSV